MNNGQNFFKENFKKSLISMLDMMDKYDLLYSCYKEKIDLFNDTTQMLLNNNDKKLFNIEKEFIQELYREYIDLYTSDDALRYLVNNRKNIYIYDQIFEHPISGNDSFAYDRSDLTTFQKTYNSDYQNISSQGSKSNFIPCLLTGTLIGKYLESFFINDGKSFDKYIEWYVDDNGYIIPYACYTVSNSKNNPDFADKSIIKTEIRQEINFKLLYDLEHDKTPINKEEIHFDLQVLTEVLSKSSNLPENFMNFWLC